MLGSAEVLAFVPATDLTRARHFYEEVLGRTVREFTPYALVLDGIRITLVPQFTPQPFTVLGWAVSDLRGALAVLAGKGVVFLRYDGMGQDSDSVWTTPAGDLVAWFQDPDGNTLSITEFSSPSGS